MLKLAVRGILRNKCPNDAKGLAIGNQSSGQISLLEEHFS